jgi:hypothetical protein
MSRLPVSRVKYWEIIADNLHDAGFSLGWVSAIDYEGRTISIVGRMATASGSSCVRMKC